MECSNYHLITSSHCESCILATQICFQSYQIVDCLSLRVTSCHHLWYKHVAKWNNFTENLQMSEQNFNTWGGNTISWQRFSQALLDIFIPLCYVSFIMVLLPLIIVMIWPENRKQNLLKYVSANLDISHYTLSSNSNWSKESYIKY